MLLRFKNSRWKKIVTQCINAARCHAVIQKWRFLTSCRYIPMVK